MQMSRTPDILADAAYLIFQKPSRTFTGRFLIDDSFLASEGIADFRNDNHAAFKKVFRKFVIRR